MKKRTIEKYPAQVETNINVPGKGLKTWLAAEAKNRNLCWLLAHADDGVIWGRLDGDVLVTSFDAAQKHDKARLVCAELRDETLQQARLFAEKGELYIWKDGEGVWHGRAIHDTGDESSADWLEAFDETYMLWGTSGESLAHGFTFLTDGAQGMHHAVPRKLKITDGEVKQPYLIVRHYLNKTGFAQVAASRLVRFEMEVLDEPAS